MQTSGTRSGKERWCEHRGCDFRNGETSQGERRELKGEVDKKNRYLPRPVLSSYRPADLYYHHWAPHWAPQMDHCWMRPVIHQARTQEDNTFFFFLSFQQGKAEDRWAYFHAYIESVILKEAAWAVGGHHTHQPGNVLEQE